MKWEFDMRCQHCEEKLYEGFCVDCDRLAFDETPTQEWELQVPVVEEVQYDASR